MIRPAYLAGQWYPGGECECAAAIERYVAETEPKGRDWRALVGPHAGWSFSGKAAGHAFAWLAHAQPDADLVVVFGAHRGPEGPHTILRGEGWETPLGTLKNAQDIADVLALELRLRDEPATPLRPDNAAELHMPFVRYFFPKAEMLMLGVGANPDALDIGRHVGKALKERKRKAVFVGSTDLTHYGPSYMFEPVGHGPSAVDWVRDENDQGFIDHVLADAPDAALRHAVDNQSACCPGSAVAAMTAADAFGRKKSTALLDHYLSYDVMPNASFVGYASIVL